MEKLKAFFKKHKKLIIALSLGLTALAANFALFYLFLSWGMQSLWAQGLAAIGGILTAIGVYIAALLFKKHRETILYLFFGVVTTVVNFALYYAIRFVAVRFFHALPTNEYLWINTVAWIGAVLVAYVTNRRWVFESQAEGFFAVTKEFVSFVLSRLFSFGVEMLLLFIMVDVCTVSDAIAKVPVAIVTIVLNYVTGKLLVFRKKAKENTEESPE